MICCLYLVQLQGVFYVLPHNNNNVPLHCSSRLPWLPLERCVLHRDLTRDWSNARADELVRHEEYRQIMVVQCILERIHELNGRPCDQESGEIDSEMSHCHAEGVAIQVCDFEESTAVQFVSVRYEVRDDAVQHARDEPSEVILRGSRSK